MTLGAEQPPGRVDPGLQRLFLQPGWVGPGLNLLIFGLHWHDSSIAAASNLAGGPGFAGLARVGQL